MTDEQGGYRFRLKATTSVLLAGVGQVEPGQVVVVATERAAECLAAMKDTWERVEAATPPRKIESKRK